MSEFLAEGSSPAARWWAKARFTGLLWLLMVPSLLGLLVFTYYPNLEAIRFSFFNWNGGSQQELIGTTNYQDAFRRDPLFWQSFSLVGILLIANLVKMWPSIFAAIVLHRLKSDRWQYLYRVLFVLPMVIPGLVLLLIWKSFFDPTVGILNHLLNATGLMPVLAWLDTAMPAVSATAWSSASPLSWLVVPLFGSLWGLGLWGVVLLLVRSGIGQAGKLWMLWVLVLGLACLAWSRPVDGTGFLAIGETALRSLVLLGAAVWLSSWNRRHDAVDGAGGDGVGGAGRTSWIGWGCMLAALVLLLLTKVWTTPTQAFAMGQPSWLGHSKLVVPAAILWGFPWVGTFGVLLYLAGLQNISKEVYEAAELDGVGFWGKIFRIEVPLILTQVRINLIFTTIGTLTDYGFFLILLGPTGGPDNAGLTPGLYMYQQAFLNGKYGYACALGMILFVLILFLTVLYQRHFKVEK